MKRFSGHKASLEHIAQFLFGVTRGRHFLSAVNAEGLQ